MPKPIDAVIIWPNHLTLALGSQSRGILIGTYMGQSSLKHKLQEHSPQVFF